MPACDLCGKKFEKLLRAKIEETELNVCNDCGKFGKIIRGAEKEKVILPKKKITIEEVEERIVSDFADKIRKAREKRDMKQEEFAKLLNEKESVVQKWEGENLKPKIETARRLERVLRIYLVEKAGEGKVEELKETKGAVMTLGDMINIRKKKR